MSTISKEFTKEQLIEHLRTRIEHRRGLIANMHIDRGYRDYLKLELRSSEIALASLEAETVAYIRDGFRADGVHFCGGIITAEEHERTKPALSERYTWKHQPLYTAPPATVSVPDGYRLQPISEYDAMCAAMLQGANGNSPVIKDGWVACSERMPEDDDFVYIWPRPDFGVELHVGQYCECHPKGDGWYAQVYEQNYGIEWCPITVTHWMPLPAAPKQEVKP